jgi:hypothetical protein
MAKPWWDKHNHARPRSCSYGDATLLPTGIQLLMAHSLWRKPQRYSLQGGAMGPLPITTARPSPETTSPGPLHGNPSQGKHLALQQGAVIVSITFCKVN